MKENLVLFNGKRCIILGTCEAPSDGRAQKIQQQIIDLTEAPKGEKLAEFHGRHNDRHGPHAPPKPAAFRDQSPQKKAQGDEHDNIAADDIDHRP